MEYFMIGYVCFSLLTNTPCVIFEEKPKIYYSTLKECKIAAVQKTQELGQFYVDLNYPIEYIKTYCMLDNSKQT